ncbi:MAG: DUF6145 family protein [Lachnospiraceae bacterium]
MGMCKEKKMEQGTFVLCVSNAYEKKYYLNEELEGLPTSIKDELKIMCVLFSEEIGGILKLEFSEEGELNLVTEADEEDLLYDEIGSALKIKEIQKEKQELLESLELFYKIFYLGITDEE